MHRTECVPLINLKVTHFTVEYIYIHSCIFYTASSIVGHGGVGAYQNSMVGGRVHPGQVTSPPQGNTETHRTNNNAHTVTPKGNLERPVNLRVMFLDCGRNPERTHACMGRTCKLNVYYLISRFTGNSRSTIVKLFVVFVK
ncbi:hypothetical protein ILYODFUR_030397 [Ilyodon furcidens]|uniref:Uncharacterized protein n=1 Tax=Ilyodon furcidens TaxID=33524 RepID=A0ABV0TET0_9TELE